MKVLSLTLFLVVFYVGTLTSAAGKKNSLKPSKPSGKIPLNVSDIIDIDSTQDVFDGSGFGKDGFDDDEDSGLREEGSGVLIEPKSCLDVLNELKQTTSPVYVPRCTATGEYAPMQCRDNKRECWCVTADGRKIPGTERLKPNKPTCPQRDVVSTTVTTRSTTSTRRSTVPSRVPTLPPRVAPTVSLPPRVPTTARVTTPVTRHTKTSEVVHQSTMRSTRAVSVVAHKTTTSPYKSDSTITSRAHVHRSTTFVHSTSDGLMPRGGDVSSIGVGWESTTTKDEGDDEQPVEIEVLEMITRRPLRDGKNYKNSRTSLITTQPGVLAGIIGGAVIVLVCAVLLIMFIIYRLHKKREQEGDEPSTKKPIIGYTNVRDGDLYA